MVFMRKFRAFRREATELQYRFRHLGLIGFGSLGKTHRTATIQATGRSVHRLIYVCRVPAEHRLEDRNGREVMVTVNIGNFREALDQCADHAFRVRLEKPFLLGNFGKKDLCVTFMLVQRFPQEVFNFGFTDRQTIHSVDQMRTVGVVSDIGFTNMLEKIPKAVSLCVQEIRCGLIHHLAGTYLAFDGRQNAVGLLDHHIQKTQGQRIRQKLQFRRSQNPQFLILVDQLDDGILIDVHIRAEENFAGDHINPRKALAGTAADQGKPPETGCPALGLKRLQAQVKLVIIFEKPSGRGNQRDHSRRESRKFFPNHLKSGISSDMKHLKAVRKSGLRALMLTRQITHSAEDDAAGRIEKSFGH